MQEKINKGKRGKRVLDLTLVVLFLEMFSNWHEQAEQKKKKKNSANNRWTFYHGNRETIDVVLWK